MGRTKKEELPKHHQVVEAHKATRSKEYRPADYLATVEEAKAALRKRYEDRGFEVVRVNRFDRSQLTVTFPEGKGPSGLSSILCNWPYKDNATTQDEALGIKPERRVDMKKIMANPKLKKMLLDKGIEAVIQYLKEKK